MLVEHEGETSRKWSFLSVSTFFALFEKTLSWFAGVTALGLGAIGELHMLVTFPSGERRGERSSCCIMNPLSYKYAMK